MEGEQTDAYGRQTASASLNGSLMRSGVRFTNWCGVKSTDLIDELSQSQKLLFYEFYSAKPTGFFIFILNFPLKVSL